MKVNGEWRDPSNRAEYMAFWRIHGVCAYQYSLPTYNQPSWVTEMQPGSTFILEYLDSSMMGHLHREHIYLTPLETLMLVAG